MATAIALWPTLASAQWTALNLNPLGAQASAITAAYQSNQAGGAQFPGGPTEAGTWGGSSGSWQSLSPAGLGIVRGMWGDEQVGGFESAVLWRGTPGSLVSLHPSGAISSVAYATRNGQEVGEYSPATGGTHAVLWHGTAASAIDLNPPGAISSSARTTDGSRQGGAAKFHVGSFDYFHAGLWSGSAASFLDLSPSPTTDCGIAGMTDAQQVGEYFVPGQGTHAAIWSGTAASMVDVHPFPGLSSSLLLATVGWAQVGWSHVPGDTLPHAGIWFGSAASFVDLQQFLPAGFYNSTATSIDFYNGQIYIGGSATAGGVTQAILWVGVPAPGTLAPLSLGLALARRQRRTTPRTPPRSSPPDAASADPRSAACP